MNASKDTCTASADGRCYPESDGHCHWCDRDCSKDLAKGLVGGRFTISGSTSTDPLLAEFFSSARFEVDGSLLLLRATVDGGERVKLVDARPTPGAEVQLSDFIRAMMELVQAFQPILEGAAYEPRRVTHDARD